MAQPKVLAPSRIEMGAGFWPGLLVIVLAAAAPADGKTLYVCPTGDDRTTYSENDERRQWATLCRATNGAPSCEAAAAVPPEAARPGDRIVVCPGTYIASGSGSRWAPGFRLANSGTRDSPITYRCHPLESQTEGPDSKSCRLQLRTKPGPVLGCDGRSHVIFDGFYIDESMASWQPDTGPVVFHVATGCQLLNSEIKGSFSAVAPSNTNHNGVRLEDAHSCVVANNRIFNFGQHLGGREQRTENNTGITIYSGTNTSDRNTIEHNEIYACGRGVFVKGVSGGGTLVSGTIVRFNRFHSLGLSAQGVGVGDSGAIGTRVYQNLMLGNHPGAHGAGIEIKSFGDGPVDGTYQNNTIIGQTGAGGIAINNGAGITGLRFFNNIVAFSDLGVLAQQAVKDGFDFQHNVYHKNREVAAVLGSFYTLERWRKTFNQDELPPQSVTRDPLFRHPAADFRLRPESPALGMGVDLLDLDLDGATGDVVPAGAYITGAEHLGIEPTPKGADAEVQGTAAQEADLLLAVGVLCVVCQAARSRVPRERRGLDSAGSRYRRRLKECPGAHSNPQTSTSPHSGAQPFWHTFR